MGDHVKSTRSGKQELSSAEAAEINAAYATQESKGEVLELSYRTSAIL